MKKVLLIGIGGVYNYGCEAIIRGTVNILKDTDPLIEISYASYNYDDDFRRLSGCDVTIIPRPQRRRWSFKNIIRKLLSYIGITYMLPYDTLDWVKGFDTVFSIGGDIYTLNHDGSYNPALPLFLEKCQSLGLKYVLWGASVGKFEKNLEALAFYKKHLARIDKIVVREKVTLEYLHLLGITENVQFAPDPAFFVSSFIRKDILRSPSFVLGINLSPLSALYEYGDLKLAISKQTVAICRLAKKLNCHILLLPHVISSSSRDSDLLYMRAIYERVREEGYSIELVDSDPGFVGLGVNLAKCDFVMAARMHCAVNAITQSVPTLFLSYSEKAKGMAEFVYGTDNAVISLIDFENCHLVVEKMKKGSYKMNIDEIRKFDFKMLQ